MTYIDYRQMRKYLKLFNNHSQYESFVGGGATETYGEFLIPNVSHCIEENDVHYNPKNTSNEYLTFEILTDGTINWKHENNRATALTISYSLDNGQTWNDIESTYAGTSFNVVSGDKVLLKGTNDHYGTPVTTSSDGFVYTFAASHCFSGSTASFNIRGNILSLFYGDDFANKARFKYNSDRMILGGTELMPGLFQSTNVVSAENLSLCDDFSWSHCYKNLFYRCTSLTTPPKLPKTVGVYCYESMFSNCTSLTELPELPATTLAENCYYRMFSGCTGLVNIPSVGTSETKMAQSCYREMFRNCTSLVSVSELPATTLAYNCYRNMFYGCTSLTMPPALPAMELVSSCYEEMFQGCTGLVTAPELPATTLTYGCYTNMFKGCTSLVNAPELNATTLANNCYQYMFNGCTSLTNVPPIGTSETKMAGWCCYYMFQGCTGLVTAPELPATTLEGECYQCMFQGCTGLVNAPSVLPAMELKTQCYDAMFKGCTKLTNAPVLPATIMVTNCYQEMFQGCTSLVNAPALPATTLAQQCYDIMFRGCTNLVNAPELPATTLVTHCYNGMFENCKKLKYIKAMFTTTPSGTYTSTWVSGVASTGTFVKNAAAEWNVTGTSGIPSGWTVQTATE